MSMVSTAGNAGAASRPSEPIGALWRRLAAGRAARHEEARMRGLGARMLDDIGAARDTGNESGSTVKVDGVLLSGFAR